MDASGDALSPTSRLLMSDEKLFSSDEEDKGKGVLLEGGDDDNDNGDDDDDEYVKTLFQKEKPSSSLSEQEISDGNWLVRARCSGIEYILRMSGFLGYTYSTACLAVTYVDRFLSRGFIPIIKDRTWAVNLLSLTSLLLAAKLEESTVPSLSSFNEDDYRFKKSEIMRMEYVVLDALGWRMALVTPFHFTHFLTKRFFDDNPLPRNISSTIVEVIIDAMHDVKIMHHRPSVIAAAATLLALDPNLTRESLELKLGSLTAAIALNIEDVVSCYNQVQEREIERSKPTTDVESPDLTESDDIPVISFLAGGMRKRKKRLQFDRSGKTEEDTIAEKKQKP